MRIRLVENDQRARGHEEGATAKKAPRQPVRPVAPREESASSTRPHVRPPCEESASSTRPTNKRSSATQVEPQKRRPPPLPQRRSSRVDEMNDSTKKDDKDDRKKDRDDEKDSKKKDDKDDRRKGDKTDKHTKDDGKKDSRKDDRMKDDGKKDDKKDSKKKDDGKKDKPNCKKAEKVPLVKMVAKKALAAPPVKKKETSLLEDIAATMKKSQETLSTLQLCHRGAEKQLEGIDAQIQVLEEGVTEKEAKIELLQLTRKQAVADVEQQAADVKKQTKELLEAKSLHAKCRKESVSEMLPEEDQGDSESSSSTLSRSVSRSSSSYTVSDEEKLEEAAARHPMSRLVVRKVP